MLTQSDHSQPAPGLAAGMALSSFSIKPLGGFATIFK
jgi:hypothetical protein